MGAGASDEGVSVLPAASFEKSRFANKRENNMKKLMTICFALALLTLTFGVASAQDKMQNDNMKADASNKAVHVTGKVSDDGKTFVGDTDSKNWTINNPDTVKGHEGHHVILTAQVDTDKHEVHAVSYTHLTLPTTPYV